MRHWIYIGTGAILCLGFFVAGLRLDPEIDPRPLGQLDQLEERMERMLQALNRNERVTPMPDKYETQVDVCIGGQPVSITVCIYLENYDTIPKAAEAFRDAVKAAQALNEEKPR